MHCRRALSMPVLLLSTYALAAAQSVSIREYPLAPDSQPYGITSGPDGSLWFTESAAIANKIGKITTAGTVSEYSVPTPAASPVGIVTGPDGALWFTESAGNKIGRITIAGVFTEYAVPIRAAIHRS